MITDRKVSLWIGWLGLLMAGVMVLMVGCNQSNGTDQPQRPQTEGADQVSTADTAQRFVYLCEDLSLEKYQDISEGIREKCEFYGITCSVVDAEGNAGVLMDYLEEFDADAMDALLISAVTEPLGPLIKSKCDAAGIPVYTVSSRLRDKEAQDLPGIEISAYESGKAVAESIAGAIRNGVLTENQPLTVIMCSMSNMTPAKEVMAGFYNAFSNRLSHLNSDSYLELEVLSPFGEGHYFSLANYFGKIDPAMQYVVVTFDDDGSQGIVDFVREVGIQPEKLLFGSVGMQANARCIFEEELDLADRYHVVAGDYTEMGRQAVDRMYEHLEQDAMLPQIFMPLGETVTAETYRPGEVEITS